MALLGLPLVLWADPGGKVPEVSRGKLADTDWQGLQKELADGFDWRLKVLGYGLVQQPVNSPLNPENIWEIPRYQVELDLRPDLNLKFRSLELNIKPRLRCTWQHWQDGIRKGDSDGYADLFVNEWCARFMLKEDLFVSYGRENLQWGPSFLTSPSNPFNRDNGKENPIGRRFDSTDQAQETLVGGAKGMARVYDWIADMYNPKVDYPPDMTARQYIERYFPGNEEYVNYVQTIITYCFASQTVDTFSAGETKRAIVDALEQMAVSGTAVGGTAAIVDGLERVILSHDGKIAKRTRVEEILIEDGRAVGVLLHSGQEVRADVVIHNGGLNRLIKLAGEQNLPAEGGDPVAGAAARLWGGAVTRLRLAHGRPGSGVARDIVAALQRRALEAALDGAGCAGGGLHLVSQSLKLLSQLRVFSVG